MFIKHLKCRQNACNPVTIRFNNNLILIKVIVRNYMGSLKPPLIVSFYYLVKGVIPKNV